jgi:hypothetical protein
MLLRIAILTDILAINLRLGTAHCINSEATGNTALHAVVFSAHLCTNKRARWGETALPSYTALVIIRASLRGFSNSLWHKRSGEGADQPSAEGLKCLPTREVAGGEGPDQPVEAFLV